VFYIFFYPFSNTFLIYDIISKNPSFFVKKNKLFYVGPEGKLISGLNSKLIKRLKNKNDYPVITGLSENFSPEDRNRFIKLSLRLLELLSEKSLFKKSFISEINIDKKRGLSLITTRNSLPLIFGLDNFEKKVIYLNYVLSDLEKKKIEVSEINLDFNKKIVVKKKR